MDRQTKEKLKETVAGRFEKANAAVIAEYRGLKVEDLTKLRVELRKAQAEFRVLKNRVAKRAIEDKVPDSKPIASALKGPVGVVYMYGDSALATKTVLNFEKDNPNFIVKAGLMEGAAVSTNDLKAIADLPSREVLMTRLVSSLVSPHRGILGVLSAIPRDLVQVINAIKEKKS